MKRLFALCTTAALLCTLLLSGCGSQPSEPAPEQLEEPPAAELPEVLPEAAPGFTFADVAPLEFCFSSGAGGWATVLRIHEDGSFDGLYTDSDMGDLSDEYPSGTQYSCAFSGIFSPAEPVNAYTVSTRIQNIQYQREPGEEIVDGVRMIYTLPAGLEHPEELQFFLPDAPLAELPESFLQWAHLWPEETSQQTLETYGLYNVSEEFGFISYDPLPIAQDQIRFMVESAEAAEAELKEQLENPSLTQADLNDLAAERFSNWDFCLNEIWGILERTLPQEEMTALRQEERAWIAKKEAAVKEAGKEVEGGTLYPLVTGTTAADWTRDRVYVLAELLR